MKARNFALCVLLILATDISAQKCFTPASNPRKSFVEFLDALVENYKTLGWKDYYICSPAFDTSYALTVEREQLVCKKIVDAQWSEQKDLPKYKTARWVLPISGNKSKVLSDLLGAATITANYYSYSIGIDGVIYYLGSWGRLVSSWCPNEGSLPYRTVKMLDTVCFAVTSGDTSLLNKQLEVCKELTGEFRLQYPLSYFYPTVWKFRDEPNVFSVKLSCNYGRLTVKQLVESMASFKDFHYDVGPLGDTMAVWRRELFLNGFEKSIKVFLSDTSGMRCRMDIDGDVTMLIPKEKLDRQVLFSTTILSEGYYELSPDGEWIAIPEKRYKWWPGVLSFF